MKIVPTFFRASVASILLSLGVPCPAVPAVASDATETAAAVASIPFDPPLGERLRFRSEKTVQKDDKSQTHWSIADVQFEESAGGYRLTVTPVQQGTGSTDPMVKQIEQKLSHLTSRPYVLNVSSEAVITGFEDADLYWSAIFKAIEAVISDLAKPGDPLPPQVRTALAA